MIAAFWHRAYLAFPPIKREKCEKQRAVFLMYNVAASSESCAPNHPIIRGEQLPLVEQAQERRYRVDDNHEWVISGSQRICWVPPGYIRSVQASYCWAGSSLFMAGQDGTLRVLTFQ